MQSLENHFIIAMPSMEDPYFSRSVTYICEHNDDGAMGIVINQPVELNLGELFKQIKIPTMGDDNGQPVYAGGPVAQDRGFVLHSPVNEQNWSSSLQLADNIMLTTSKDILEAIAKQQGPEHYLVSLGYAGWSAGQLEGELQDNAWLTIGANADILLT